LYTESIFYEIQEKKYPKFSNHVNNHAQCLTEKNVKMYGAFWCGACASQKELFGPAFKEVYYVECDERGSDAQPEVCQLEGIGSYPTWEINGQKSTGVQPLESLAASAGCEYQS
jgi:glutaredoxin